MPSRFTILVILIFWGATTSWLFSRELLPLLLPGEPPPFTIDLDEEAQAQETEGRILWIILQNGQDKGYAESWVEYQPNKSDTFELNGDYKFWSAGRASAGDPDQTIDSTFTVNREGELRSFSTTVKVTVQHITVTAFLKGLVIDRRFTPRLTIFMPPPFGRFEQDLEPVEISSRGSVLNPLMPLNRLSGLRKGQHWRMPMVDPLGDVWRAVSTKLKLPAELSPERAEPRFLDAEVLRTTQKLPWGKDQTPIPCLVIDYHGGEDTSARTWVREDNALVLQQEVTRNGETLTLVRMDPESKLEFEKTNKVTHDRAPRGQQGLRHETGGAGAQPARPSR